MVAYNVVRFRVKPGREQEFLDGQTLEEQDRFPGLIEGALIKTGERSYCLVGKWENFDRIVAARPAMIATLDKVRDALEDLGGGLGVTDPVSGEVVMEVPMRR